MANPLLTCDNCSQDLSSIIQEEYSKSGQSGKRYINVTCPKCGYLNVIEREGGRAARGQEGANPVVYIFGAILFKALNVSWFFLNGRYVILVPLLAVSIYMTIVDHVLVFVLIFVIILMAVLYRVSDGDPRRSGA